jgi:hypothetical protein
MANQKPDSAFSNLFVVSANEQVLRWVRLGAGWMLRLTATLLTDTPLMARYKFQSSALCSPMTKQFSDNRYAKRDW